MNSFYFQSQIDEFGSLAKSAMEDAKIPPVSVEPKPFPKLDFDRMIYGFSASDKSRKYNELMNLHPLELRKMVKKYWTLEWKREGMDAKPASNKFDTADVWDTACDIINNPNDWK